MNARKERDSALERLRRARDCRDGLSPLAAELSRALAHNPSWRGEYPSWIAVAVWAHEYTEHKPTRQEVASALEELAEAFRRQRGAAGPTDRRRGSRPTTAARRRR